MMAARFFLAALAAMSGVCPAFAADDALQYYNEESNARGRLGWSRVTTALRQEESLRKSPASVEVITAEEIRASGAVNIWDLLRFRAGLDVEDSGSSGLAAVSIRGFARTTIRQLQVLIDGRSVYSPSRSSVNWEQLPVQLQDIDRIEIVRGPNAVLYGSNAAVGVINIITKRPSGRKEWSVGGLAGNEGLLRSEAAVEESAGKFRFRLSQTHLSRDGTSSQGGGADGDFLFSNKQNLQARWDLKRGRALDIFAGGSWDDLGNSQSGARQPSGQSRYRENFEMARLTQEIDSGQLEIVGSRNEVETHNETSVGPRALREFQYDAEAVHRVIWLDDRLHTISGLSYRLAVAESDQLFTGYPKQQNRVARGFFDQSVRLSSVFTLTGGISWEHSDTSGYEPAYQFAGVLELRKDHFFRLSYSFAPTLPSLFDEHGNSQDSATKRRVGNPNLYSDHLRSYEAGYQGIYFERLAVDVSVFYLDHRDLNESFVVSKIAGVTTSSFDNANAAIARGGELAIKLKLGRQREVYANYTYESTTDRAGNLEISAGTPRHKFNAGGRAALWRGFSIGGNLGYKDAYVIGTPTSGFQDVPAYWRLDGRLGYSPCASLEVFVAGQNLAQPFHSKEFQNSNAVPRTYQVGLSVRF